MPPRRSESDDGPVDVSRLPPGRHGLPRELVARNQRERLITGLADAVAVHGYPATTIAHITKAAGVSRRTFYEHFKSKEECFLAAFDLIVDHLRSAMLAAAQEFDQWPRMVVGALQAMLHTLAAEPDLARLCVLESIVAGRAGAERYRAAIEGFVPLLRFGRSVRAEAVQLPEVTEEVLAGGIASLITQEIRSGRAERLEALLAELVELVLTPYVGAAEAQSLARSAA